MHIAVVGTGYVGLVVGACLAETGHRVVCADHDEAKVARLNDGEIPIFEPGLEPLVDENLAAGRLEFTTDVETAIKASRVVFIAVGTPSDGDGSANLENVLSVARVIGRSMERETIVVTKSTVPIGTAPQIRDAIAAETDVPFHVCSNPEFLKEGAAVDDFLKPDRVVLGVDVPSVAAVLSDLYAPFVRSGNEIIIMDVASAELTKYAANAMLATRISFMNMIARLCAETGANVDAVRHGIGSDSRIGSSFLFPGIGYGGSCFPKDVKALIHTAQNLGVDASMLNAVEAVNQGQKHWITQRVLERFGDELTGRTFGIWGLAFKPQTDDLREAPSLVTLSELTQRGARIRAHDPVAMEEARRRFEGSIELVDSDYAAVEGADALLIHTEWHPYRRPDFPRLLETMRTPVIIDGRNLYDPAQMAQLGFEYYSVGRPYRVPSPNV